jgi:hypothetical protein
MTRPTFTLPNMGPMLRRWDREHAALDAEPYTVRAKRQGGERPIIARLGDRAYYTYGRTPESFRTVPPVHAAKLDAAYAELRAIHARIDDIARSAYTAGRPITQAECAAAERRVYGNE